MPLSWTPTNDYVGSNTVNITVSDGSLTDTELITITVTNTNDAPTVTSVFPTENKTIAEGVGSQLFNATLLDVDVGDFIFIKWFRNGTLLRDVATAQTVPSTQVSTHDSIIISELNEGIYNITITLNDTETVGARYEWTLTVTTGIIFDGLTSPILEGLNQSQRENVTDVMINHTTRN
jgi:PKD repeat protein